MRNIFSFTILIIGFFVSTDALSQDFNVDYKKWQQSFENIESFSTDMRIVVYDNYNTKTVSQERKSSVLKNGNSFLMHLDDLEIVYADSLSIMIDHRSKNISLGSYYPDSLNITNKITAIDTLLNKFDSTIYLGEINNRKNYRIYLSNNTVKEIDVSFNAESFFLEKTIYFYDNRSVKMLNAVEVVFQNTKINEALPADIISIEKYLKVKSGIIVPSHEFSSYKIHYASEQ